MNQLLLILITLCVKNIQCLFTSGKEYTYTYNAASNAGVLLPSAASSSWGLYGRLVIQARHHAVVMQLESLKMNTWNGINSEQQGISISIKEIVEPFEIVFANGLIQNMSVQSEPVWVTNIKRSIAGIFQLDLLNLKQHVAFHSEEINHYGRCNTEYVVSLEGNNEKLVRKYMDPNTCIGHPKQIWSNLPKLKCSHKFHQSILKSSERQYKIKTNGTIYKILSVNTSGGVYVESLGNDGTAQFHFTQQNFNLVSVQNITRPISMNGSRFAMLKHEFTDLKHIYSATDRESIFLIIKQLLDRLSESLERTSLDTDTKILHNTTIPVLLYYLSTLSQVDLQHVYDQNLDNTYKGKMLRNMFLEILPQVGTQEATFFILNLVTQKKVTDVAAIELLTKLPFYIKNPNVALLVKLESCLNLPMLISEDVKHTAILTYGTLIYKTCILNCTSTTLDNYVQLYVNKFTEAEAYKSKMIWLQGLANIQLGKVNEFLETVIRSNHEDMNNLRTLAAWRSLPMVLSRPNHTYSVYWPILVNKTEHLEMRIIALTVLLMSDSIPRRLISLYWYMQTETSQHVYNYFYTTIKSMAHTTYPCYVQIGKVAAQLVHILRKPLSNLNITTSGYLFDYMDTYKNFGRMVNAILIANPRTNIPEAVYVTLNSYGNDISMNDISLYVKAKDVQSLLPTYFNNSTQIKDLLLRFPVDEKSQYTEKYLEVVVHLQEKAIFYKHLNQNEIANTFSYLSNLTNNIYRIYQNMNFHINEQHIYIPLTMEFLQASELGTDLRHAVTTTSFISIRGSFAHILNDLKNQIILRSSSHTTDVIENYNPFVDLWYTVEKSQSIHGYIPVNITMGLREHLFILYEVPKEYMKTGFIAHVRTTTNIRGTEVLEKLRKICPMCPLVNIVKKAGQQNVKATNLFNVSLTELGGEMYIESYNCEENILKEQLPADILSSHQVNHQGYLALKVLLIGFHFLDYISYVPPKGNCGLAAYIETSKSQNSQVKFTFAKNEMHYMVSLIYTDLKLGQVLYQWNLVALYEATSWVSDILKIKATRITADKTVIKVCFEAERNIPFEWDILSIKPSNPMQLKLNVVWGLSNTAKGKCTGSSMQLSLLGRVTNEQIEESKSLIWPYSKCYEEKTGKTFVPYTWACYEASRELSTFRHYEISFRYKNIPDTLSRLIWKFCALYDTVSGNSSSAAQTGEFVLTVIFPKDSNIAKLQFNEKEFSIQYDIKFIENLLIRTRIHDYVDTLHQMNLFSMCTVSPNAIRSSSNRTFPFDVKRNILLLGQCYSDNPSFAIIAENIVTSTTITFMYESNVTKIVAYENGGALYNSTKFIPVEQNFAFHNIDSISVRMDKTSVELLFPSLLLYVHWTQEQVLFFFPNHLLESSCGICIAYNSNTTNFYEKLE